MLCKRVVRIPSSKAADIIRQRPLFCNIPNCQAATFSFNTKGLMFLSCYHFT